MAGPSTFTHSSNVELEITKPGSDFKFALVSLTSLFFLWGFITSLNDVLIPYLKGMFQLNYTQAMLIQFCFFSAYFIVSIPAGSLVSRVGYKNGILTGLFIAGIGCLLFFPAAEYRVYGFFLAALFVLASGIAILQVSANPYVSVLGTPDKAPARLTLTQAFNSLGTTIAPIWIGPIILAGIALANSSDPTAVDLNRAIQLPYVLLGFTLFLLGLVFFFLRLPPVSEHQVQQNSTPIKSVLKKRHLLLGVFGIFAYVGAEVGIGSFIVSFLSMPNIGALEETEASKFIGYYFGGAMVGRFVGAAIMHRIRANKLLTVNALMAVALVTIAITASGKIAMWAIVLVGLCNSIMFPSIFALAITKLGPLTSRGAGLLCLAIVGGAIIPLLQGVVADLFGIQLAFIVPALCYLYIAFYGFNGYRFRSGSPQG